MFIAGDFLVAVARILNTLLSIYMWIVIIRALLSWVRPDPYNPIVRFINGLVDPVSYRISRIIPTRIGMVDLSPFILLLLILFLKQFGVMEDQSSDYPPRTIKNVQNSDGTVWFGNVNTPGGKLTIGTARREGKALIVNPDPDELRQWIISQNIVTLNVAGDREENDPGIRERVETILIAAFGRL